MNIVPYFLCLSGVIGLSFSDLQLSEKFVTKSVFSDALAQVLVKISESEERILKAQQAGTLQFSSLLKDNLSLVFDLMQLRGSKGKEKFSEAVQLGDNFFVRAWIKAGFPVNEIDPVFEETPLAEAARFGYSSIVKDLLNAGANPNEKGKLGMTPLHQAAQSGHSELVDRLIQAGANPNQKNEEAETPLHWAIAERRKDAALHLIAAGANPNERDRFGCTPLHTAVLEDMPEVVESLLRAGTNETIQDNKGRVPKDYVSLRALS